MVFGPLFKSPPKLTTIFMTNLFASDDLKKVDIVGEYWIKVRTGADVDTMAKISRHKKKVVEGEMSDIDLSIIVCMNFIKEWNFTKPKDPKDPDHRPGVLPITEDVMRALKAELFVKMSDAVVENNEDIKAMFPKDEEAAKELDSKITEEKKEDTPALN